MEEDDALTTGHSGQMRGGASPKSELPTAEELIARSSRAKNDEADKAKRAIGALLEEWGRVVFDRVWLCDPGPRSLVLKHFRCKADPDLAVRHEARGLRGVPEGGAESRDSFR